MNPTKEAAKDAREYARAKMFYGDGAGTRRRLITATVNAKAQSNAEYAQAFRKQLALQDMSEHAKKAVGERRRKDSSRALSKNVKGMLTGNNKSLNTGVLVAVTLAYVAHQTGFDRKVMAKGRSVWEDVQAKRRRKKHIHAVHNVTNLRY